MHRLLSLMLVVLFQGLPEETDIESREWKRCSNHDASLPPEHPRASTTDDVECIFSVLRDMVGKHFTLKEVKFGWRKACVEFVLFNLA